MISHIYVFVSVLVVALLTYISGHCPLNYPYAYSYGAYCCAFGYEKVDLGFKGCSGRAIRFDSGCCRQDKFAHCGIQPCYNYYTETWERWSPCSKSCNTGISRRRMLCTDPEVSCNPREEQRKCNQQKCQRVLNYNNYDAPMVSMATLNGKYFNHCFIGRYEGLSLLECRQKCLDEKCFSLSFSRNGICVLNQCMEKDGNKEIEHEDGEKFVYYEFIL